MIKIIFRLINPVNYIKAYLYHKRNPKYDKSAFDLELCLYSKILENDMLHYGYFDDIDIQPDTISIKQIEDAQIKYAENIIEQIDNIRDPVLDVGWGEWQECFFKKDLLLKH